jgi:hypothetical protein
MIEVGATAMRDISIVLDLTGEQALACDICDEALEAAAGLNRAGSYTLFFCTALDHCPGA